MMNVIIIPARAGSLRLKNKNMLKIKDQTLVEKTIIFSKKIKKIDKIIVSSNDPKVLAYSKIFKNIYFIKRPQKLSSSKSLIIDTLIYLNKLFKEKFENILMLQPTSPYRSLNLVNYHWIKFITKRKKYRSKISISKANSSEKKKFLVKNKYIILNKKKNDPRNYEANGNFFMVNTNFLKKYKKFVVSNNTEAAIISNKKNMIDIDTKQDYILATKYK